MGWDGMGSADRLFEQEQEQERHEKYTQNIVKKNHARRLVKPILQKYGVRALNGLNWLRIGSDSVPV